MTNTISCYSSVADVTFHNDGINHNCINSIFVIYDLLFCVNYIDINSPQDLGILTFIYKKTTKKVKAEKLQDLNQS